MGESFLVAKASRGAVIALRSVEQTPEEDSAKTRVERRGDLVQRTELLNSRQMDAESGEQPLSCLGPLRPSWKSVWGRLHRS